MEVRKIIPDFNSEIVNPQKQKFWKLIFVFSVLGIAFIILIARLATLQIIDSDRYKQLAKQQHESTVKLKADRGDIYDCKGRLLATTIRSYSYAIDPTILKDTIKIKAIVRHICDITGDDFLEILKKVKISKKSFIWLARGLSPDLTSSLDTMKVRGFIKIEEPRRIYPYGSIASQIIGCTDIDNNGLAGIELTFDSLMKGSTGIVLMLRDAVGKLNPTTSKPLVEPVRGKSLQLTIDIELQRIAEHELLQGIQQTNSDAGSVVIQEPASGRILAIASYPTYNPNDINEIVPGAMKNRAVTDSYEPGSTFKLITAAAALEENLISVNDIVDGFNGLASYDDYVIKDDHPIGRVKFHVAFEQSSNIVFSGIAYKIPSNKYFKYIRDFGFGLLHGIEIPGETKGKIKSPDQLNGVTKRFLGFGYGISSTPLQMLVAYSTVANDGKMMKPYLIEKITNPDNTIYSDSKPLKIREVISHKTARILSELLTGVVDRGTGRTASIIGIKIAGKTGTSQQITDSAYSKQHYTASFAGFLPSDNPKMTMMIVLDKPKGNIYGGSTAAPIFRNIASSWISVSRDFLNDTKNSQPVSSGEHRSVLMPDFSGYDAKSAYRMLNLMNLRSINKQGNYIVTDQLPITGVIVDSSVNVHLYSRKSNNNATNNVVGLELRRALAILGNMGIKSHVSGTGKVINQSWLRNQDGAIFCKLLCR